MARRNRRQLAGPDHRSRWCILTVPAWAS